MKIEPMRTISFDGETVYTVPCPVEANAEMTQPVGVDGEGRLFTEPGGGGGGGTSDHSQLSNRDASDQHPVSAITGLQTALNGKQDTLTAGSGINIVNNVISATGGGGGGGDNVFNVEYQVTPFASIKSASDAGKVCRMKIGVRIYYLLSINASVGYFFWAAQGKNRMIVGCTSAGVWTDETADYVQTQAITDPGNYFAVDTVEDALQEIGAALSGLGALLGSGVIF